MDWDLIERLIGLVEQTRVARLDLSTGGTRVTIERRPEPAEPPPDRRDPGSALASRSDAGGPIAPAPAGPAPPAKAVIIAAGMFGTFYRSPAPGQPPFVVEGDVIAEGQTLAILEAMKMLNPVEADRAGRITRIFVEDGTSVEAGAPLFALAGG